MQAMDRITRKCMSEFGVVMTPTGLDGATGMTAPDAATMQAAATECQRRLVKAGLAGDYKLTNDELRANFERSVRWRACIRARGFQLPADLSEDAYIASGGSLDLANGVDQILANLTRAQSEALASKCPQ
jgi:hypothetical protein